MSRTEDQVSKFTPAPPLARPPRVERRIERRIERWQHRHEKDVRRRPPKKSRLGESGTARGQVIEVGSVDAGWTMPGPVTLRDGTAIQYYKDGQGLTAAFQAIKNAKEQICLEVYIFHSDDTGRAFADLLAEKAKSGVRVFVIYDSFGSVDSDPAMFEKMRKAGVHLAEFHPLRPWDCRFGWRPVNRDHRKLLVIDNLVAGMGGLNVGMEYGSGFLAPKARKCDCWRDNGIGVIGPGALMFAECFAKTWEYVHKGGKIRRAEFMRNLLPGATHVRRRGAERLRWEQSLTPERAREAVTPEAPPPPDHGPRLVSELAVLASVPGGTRPVSPLLTTLVRSAKQTLDMTIAYFAPSDDLIEELVSAAKRGVRVRLMLPGKCDVPAVRLASRSFYGQLMTAGVQIWERQGAILHAKTMCADERVTVIGSLNLDYRSIEFNCELSAVIRSTEFGAIMSRLFEHDTDYATRMSLEKWRRRPTWDRVVQWAASRARYLL